MTELVGLDDSERVVVLLANGGVVAIPTDTVYGVAAALDNAEAVARLFRLKQRPETVALPVLIGSYDQLSSLGVALSSLQRQLAERHWPGPLTMIVAAPAWLAQRVGSTTNTVGLRMPDDEQLLALLSITGPLAVTSANEHRAPACHDVDEVAASFAASSDLDAIVDGGRRDGAASTVVDLAVTPWRLVRDGPISASDVTRLLGSEPA